MRSMDESCDGSDRYREMTFARTNVGTRVMLAPRERESRRKTVEPSAAIQSVSTITPDMVSRQRWKKSQRGKRTTFSRARDESAAHRTAPRAANLSVRKCGRVNRFDRSIA